MNNYYLTNLMDTFFKPTHKNICNSCIYQKKGLDTLCEQFKLKPSSVREWGRCNKYHPIGE